jgi:hypothetical protein
MRIICIQMYFDEKISDVWLLFWNGLRELILSDDLACLPSSSTTSAIAQWEYSG